MMAAPSGVVSLYNVLQFYAKSMVDLVNMLREMEAVAEIGSISSMAVSDSDQKRVRELCNIFATMCDAHGWVSIQRKSQRIMDLVDRGKLTTQSALRPQLCELRERMEDELDEQFFLHLEARDVPLYTIPTKGWEDVVKRFPKTKQNIVESGKCFAVDVTERPCFTICL